jgi:hypothetical protein
MITRCNRACFSWQTVISIGVLLIIFNIVNGQEHSGEAIATIPDSSKEGWYRPPPPSPDKEFHLLPASAEQLVVRVPAGAQSIAIDRLADIEIIRLTEQDCRRLEVPFKADGLLEALIEKKKRHVDKRLREMGIPFFAKSIEMFRQDIAQTKTEIAHWKALKGNVRPYLVRGVKANGIDRGVYATWWRDSLIVTHSSEVIANPAEHNHNRASIILNADPSEVQKAPVVVYLRTKPEHVYTMASVIRLGQ